MDQVKWKSWFDENRQGWNARTPIHLASPLYDVAGWLNGKSSLNPLELLELGSVAGKTMLHLQCHFGLDSLSWVRQGATVTGVDFSEVAVKAARVLAAEAGLKARFVCCNVYETREKIARKFDIVFTSYGSVGWLPDLNPWAAVIAASLKRKGVFYMADFHPVLWMMNVEMTQLTYPYHNSGVIETIHDFSYADKETPLKLREFGWNHSLSAIITALLDHGLKLEFLHEFPYSPYPCFNNLVEGEDGNYRILGLENILPMVYSIRARK
jgi:SAM-dependent methyltransferase